MMLHTATTGRFAQLKLLGVAAAILILVAIVASSGFRSIPAAPQQAKPTTASVEWVAFTSTTVMPFRVLLPSTPRHMSATRVADGGEIQQDGYAGSDQAGITYMVNVLRFSKPVDMSNPDKSLETALNNALASKPDYRIVSSSFTTLSDQHRALDYLVKNSNDNSSMRGRAVLAGQSEYVLMVISHDAFNEADYGRFMNSFEIVSLPL